MSAVEERATPKHPWVKQGAGEMIDGSIPTPGLEREGPVEGGSL
ncbi:hypothetical protein SGL43_04104 [Streptomyces globisporus]|uniref:Uncharacterized protein n=1 Tax=Streptomyces globisporus TaxID=1908 RepID=A0ABM9H0I3_STRGL|nr:hypothetical protein SGL43_04104 [Streptomyces globisporus]